MKNFLRNNYDKILIGLAFIFALSILFFYFWGAQFLVASFDRATELKKLDGGEIRFNIDRASSALGF